MASMEAQNEHARLLRELHQPGNPLVLCNVYDAATARIVASNPASKAIATASFAIAAVAGEEDNSMKLETNLAAIQKIGPVAIEYGKPLTVDIQDGYGDKLEEVITAIIELGAVGCNLEDRNNSTGELYSIEEATARIKRALSAAAKAGLQNFALNARTDALLTGRRVNEAILRAQAYLSAGATTAFVWGGPKRGGMTTAEVETITQALDGRLNVKLNIGEGYLTVAELKHIGVARISVGPELYKQAMRAFADNSSKLLEA